MSIKETNLVSIANGDLSSNDFVRVLNQSDSRKITVLEFAEVMKTELELLGFEASGNSQTRKCVTKTANYTLTLDDSVVLCDTSGGAVTIALPTAASAYTTATLCGQQFTVKRITGDSNSVIVTPAGSDTIDGGTLTLSGSALTMATFVSDGTDWWIVA